MSTSNPSIEVYGQAPNEADRPSLQQAKGKDERLDKLNHKLLLSSGKVRMAIQCGECYFVCGVCTRVEREGVRDRERERRVHVYTCTVKVESQNGYPMW